MSYLEIASLLAVLAGVLVGIVASALEPQSELRGGCALYAGIWIVSGVIFGGLAWWIQ